MYKKVVVPLDGSKLAEVVLPHLEEIAKGCSIPEIVLVSVTEHSKVKAAVEKISNVPPAMLTEGNKGSEYMDRDYTVIGHESINVGKMGRTAELYLKKISDSLRKRGFNSTTKVLIGKPVDEIVRFADEAGADLIVMASWGEHGMSNWSVANAAEKVFRRVSIPMMLIKPPADFKETKPRRKGKPE